MPSEVKLSEQRKWLWGLFLIALVVVAYSGVMNAGFIWDDDKHLSRNACVVGPLGFKEIWTSAHAFYYPLVLTTFWLLHKFVGLNPSPYHLLNVVLHGCSAVVLWRRVATAQGSRRMAGSGDLGVASGHGAICGLGD